MLSHIVFGKGPYKVAVLVKESAMRKTELEEQYVKPLVLEGIPRDAILFLSLEYNQNNKAPVRFIKDYSKALEGVLNKHSIQHVLIADAAYFKVLCKVRKAEPHFGYVLPTIWPGVQAALTINYLQLFYNPSLKNKLLLGIKAIANEYLGDMPVFFENIFIDVEYPEGLSDIEKALQKLLNKPALTCDIETSGLSVKSLILSIAFAWDKHSGISFRVLESSTSLSMLRIFFEQYKGKLIFHNATFDTKILIRKLWMKNLNDIKGMLKGLDILYRDIDDTKILTYLATNNAVENKLSLKEQAFEYTGNYEVDSIQNAWVIEPKELLKYNLTDTLATWFVYDKWRDKVRQEQEHIYQTLLKPSLKTLTQMELSGMPMGKQQIYNADMSLVRKKVNINRQLKNHPIIKQFQNELKLNASIDANEKLKVKTKTEKDFDDLEFNPRSSKQIRSLLYESLSLPVFRYTDTNLPSTDGKTLDSLINYIEKTYNL